MCGQELLVTAGKCTDSVCTHTLFILACTGIKSASDMHCRSHLFVYRTMPWKKSGTMNYKEPTTSLTSITWTNQIIQAGAHSGTKREVEKNGTLMKERKRKREAKACFQNRDVYLWNKRNSEVPWCIQGFSSCHIVPLRLLFILSRNSKIHTDSQTIVCR